MEQSAGDPVPSVSEADATGDIAALYSDIRKTLGMSFVNLIWRNLASIPGGLRWVWTTVKPLYVKGVIEGEAAALRNNQKLPAVPRLTSEALRAVGVNAEGEAAIRAALIGYDRGNPFNVISFSAVQARLDGRDRHVMKQVRTTPMEVASSADLPTMLNFNQMSAEAASLVRLVNLIGARGDARNIQVSLPRNLAHWPGFLSLYYKSLKPLHEDGSLFEAIDAVIEDGKRRGEALSGYLGATDLPDDNTANAVRQSLNALVPGAMGRMIPVVSLLLKIMPEQRRDP